jgi:tetratricopeptide (TPR) repeat protein
MSQIAIYIGWYAENVEGPLRSPKVEFMPGAIAYHLHSYSAASLRETNRFWVGPLLARGATVTMGCVSEPYLTFTPDVATFTAALMFRAFSFGEAAYAGLNSVSWQTTVVGDPLYRPFGKSPEALQKGLEAEHSKMIEWSFLRLANLGLMNGKTPGEVAGLLENVELSKRSAVLQEKLGDLYAAAGKPSSALHAYEQALKLEPSPMQKLRLLLTVSEKHIAASEDAEAYASLQRILNDFPEYPDKAAIEQKMLPIARKLGKTADAEKATPGSK